MSSFVIDKMSYVRVGAIVAGIAKATRGTERELWIYDYDNCRNMKGTDYSDKFVECYNLNVESVCKQYAHDPVYGNPETYKDENDYLDEYVRYFKYGQLVVNDTMALMDVIWNLTNFSRSVSYQIEDPVCNEVVMSFFNMVIAKLVHIAEIGEGREQWGHFDLELDHEKALD